MKLTYSEQLKHPNWQRIRLQILSRADFKCEVCGDEGTTLHVHHKQYIKGRMAWEYEESNFQALCENCHEEIHASKETINKVIAQIPSVFLDDVADLLIGWAAVYLDGELLIEPSDPRTKMIGQIADRINMTMNAQSIESLLGKLNDYRPYKDGLEFNIPKKERTANIDDDFGL